MKLVTAVTAALFLGLGCHSGSAQLVYQPTIVTGTPEVDAGDDGGMTIITVPPPDAGDGTPLNGCTPVGSQESCYTGPAATIGADGCHPGTTTCENGGYWGDCAGESVPTPSLTDIVFVFDNTDDTIDQGIGIPEFVAVQQTIENFILAYPEVNFRWGLITVPGCGHVWPGWTDAGYALFQPLTGETGAIHAISFQCVSGSVGTGDPQWATSPPPSYVVMLKQLQGDIIPWDLGAQHFLIDFTAVGPPPPAAIQATLAEDMDGGVQTIIFVEPAYALACNSCGQVYPLSDDLEMLSQLETTFTTVLTCQ